MRSYYSIVCDDTKEYIDTIYTQEFHTHMYDKVNALQSPLITSFLNKNRQYPLRFIGTKSELMSLIDGKYSRLNSLSEGDKVKYILSHNSNWTEESLQKYIKEFKRDVEE